MEFLGENMKKQPKIKAQTEHDEQVSFFKLVDLYSKKHPELLNVFAIPNGGHRNKAVAAKLKAEGVRAGYPDIAVDVARRGYHGLRIELKRRDGGAGLSRAQSDWFCWLMGQGYLCHMAKGSDEAWAVLCWYLQLPITPEPRINHNGGKN